MCQWHNLDNNECQILICSSMEKMALVIYDVDTILYFLLVSKIKGERILIYYVHSHLALQFSLLCPSLGSVPWGKNAADRKEKEKKKKKKHLPISACRQWKGLEWDGKHGVIQIAEKLMNVRILHVVTCIPPGRERLGIMRHRVTGSRSLHHQIGRAHV